MLLGLWPPSLKLHAAGKWNNLFTTTIMVTNTSAETELHVSEIYVQFQQGEPKNAPIKY